MNTQNLPELLSPTKSNWSTWLIKNYVLICFLQRCKPVLQVIWKDFTLVFIVDDFIENHFIPGILIDRGIATATSEFAATSICENLQTS